MKLPTLILGCVLVLAGVVGTVVTVVFLKANGTVFISVLAVGLALALQKYVASFFAYFVILLSKIYDIGDRIRISNIKGDVQNIGLLHTTLEEVGEDEKLGGELTGRLLHVPNLIILDQPVLNFSKDYSVHQKTISSDYIFDEVRIPLTTESNAKKASEILAGILACQGQDYLVEAREMFQDGYPKFLDEATIGPRILVHVEPQRIWISGKFVTPVKQRNELRSKILFQFFEELKANQDIRLA
jgi:small-conductance mechanosensitive channel